LSREEGGSKVFVIPEVDESKPVAGNLNEVFVNGDVKGETQTNDEVAAKNGEVSEKLDMPPVSGKRAPVINNVLQREENLTRDTNDFSTKEQNKGNNVLSVLTETKLDKDVEIGTAEENNEKETEMESLEHSHSIDKLTPPSIDKNIPDKNGTLAINGVHEHLSSKEMTRKENGEAEPELVTVKEGYNLAAPKQKVMLPYEGQNSAKLNDVLSNEKSVGQPENKSRQQERTADINSDLLPLEVSNEEKDARVFRPPPTTNQNSCESTAGSYATAANNKPKTSLELSNIPLTFEKSDTGKDNSLNSSLVSKKSAEYAAEKGEENLQKSKVNEIKKGGKTDTVNQSRGDKKSRDAADDNLWVLKVPAGEETGLTIRSEENRNDERKNKRKRSTENDKKPEQVIPLVTIDQSEVFERTEKETTGEVSDNRAERHNREDDEDEKPRKRRVSEPDARMEPLSPLMEDRESNNMFFNPSGAQTVKVKRNKSLMSRGLSKMFGGSKRKYKTDKGEKDISPVPGDSDNNATRGEFDFKENRREKKKRKQDRSDKKNEGQSHEGGGDKSPSRKLGSLFSRGKKKEKTSNKH